MKGVSKSIIIILLLVIVFDFLIFIPSSEIDDFHLNDYRYNNQKTIYSYVKINKTDSAEGLEQEVNNLNASTDFVNAKPDPNSNFTQEMFNILKEVCESKGFDPYFIAAIGAEESNYVYFPKQSYFGGISEYYYTAPSNGTNITDFRDNVNVCCNLFQYYIDTYDSWVINDTGNKTYELVCMYAQGPGNYKKSKGSNDIPWAYPQIIALYNYYKATGLVGSRDDNIFIAAGLERKGGTGPFIDNNKKRQDPKIFK